VTTALPAKVLQALGDPTRRAIVERLSQGPTSVSRLAEPLGVTLTAIAQHLQVLQDCGLARTEKVGRVRVCSLDTAGLDALDGWTRQRRTLLEQSLDRLGEMLAEDDGPI
jgi:DNA-binding transcriptional ArsR family regulator